MQTLSNYSWTIAQRNESTCTRPYAIVSAIRRSNFVGFPVLVPLQHSSSAKKHILSALIVTDQCGTIFLSSMFSMIQPPHRTTAQMNSKSDGQSLEHISSGRRNSLHNRLVAERIHCFGGNESASVFHDFFRRGGLDRTVHITAHR
jgi:hypothetical protein